MYRKPRWARASSPWLEGLDALGQRALQVQRADDPVLGRAQREIDHRHRHQVGFRPGLELQPGAVVAESACFSRVAGVAAADQGAHRRQQCRQRAHRGGLPGAAVAEHQHAADARIHRCGQDGQLHFILADDRGKGEGLCHRFTFSLCSGIPAFAWSHDPVARMHLPCRAQSRRRQPLASSKCSVSAAGPGNLRLASIECLARYAGSRPRVFASVEHRDATGWQRYDRRFSCGHGRRLFRHGLAVGAVAGEELHLARSTGVGCANRVFDAQYVTSE
jgi:hypothetical protein